MATDDLDDPLRRLQILQCDLIAFTESRLPNLARLQTQLDASAEDFRALLERKKKNDASRAILAPSTNDKRNTITIDHVEYQIGEQFRESALQVADELDLDEIDAARLCIRSQRVDDGEGSSQILALRAVLRFHEQRHALLSCLRILMQLGYGSDSGEDHSDAFRGTVTDLVRGEGGGQKESSAYWTKCLDALADVEKFLGKVTNYRDKLSMTGQTMTGDVCDWLVAQRLLLTRQHESISAVISYLIQGSYAQPEDYRILLSKSAALDAEFDITIHYLPILIRGAEHFTAENITTPQAAHDLHMLFADGPGQLQWKQGNIKAAATVSWLAEYSKRFSADSPDPNQSQEERDRDDKARSKLFFEALQNRAFHFMLAAAASLRPVVWHDPARNALIEFLVDSAVVMPAEAPRPSDEFSTLTMAELQVFADAFVTHMPDTLRRLKTEEDDRRRLAYSQPVNGDTPSDYELERFITIMTCAYQGDADAAREFWSDRDSNLYGFVRWVSQRLPTPRVAAFCGLLKSLACDEQSANHAHRFLLEDTVTSTGKLRKAFAVSWAQIFNELELYTTSQKDRPSAPHNVSEQDRGSGQLVNSEPETGIMLESYLGLTSHICRTSPDARTWLLKEQPFHLGEVMFQLARSGYSPRIQACCLDVLAALLTDKTLEVRNGIWVLLDSWISTGATDGGSLPRGAGRPQFSAKHYLEAYANNAESGASLIGLLNALAAPAAGSYESSIDALPFPENLGAPHRHPGIESYVDFVMGTVFAQRVPLMALSTERILVNLMRYQCLEFACRCLSDFNDNLVMIANITTAGLESTLETKSLASYARLHPFARVMEWLFDRDVVSSLFAALQQNLDALNDADPNSPLVQATLRGAKVLNLAWSLQPTYSDLVKPMLASQASRAQPMSSTWTSIDEIFLTHLHVVVDVAQFTACRHVEISLECLKLLHSIGASRKLSEIYDSSSRNHYVSRLTSVLAPIGPSLTLELSQDFYTYPWDLDTREKPLKVIKASAVLELLNASLDASPKKSTIAHCLLGFNCGGRTVEILPHSAFASSTSLFHAIVACAANTPTVTDAGHTSWLLSLKRGCLEVILKLACAPMTSAVVQPQLRSMDFLAALSHQQVRNSLIPLWDGKPIHDGRVLLDSSASAIRDLMHIREIFFELAATDLRTASQQGSHSVREKIISILFGTITLPSGEEVSTSSIFDVFDFFDLETIDPFTVPKSTYFTEEDVSNCTKDDPETLIAFDVSMAEQVLILRKRQLKEQGRIKEPSEQETADNEMQAILAALVSQNNFAAIKNARLDALEAWTDLLSMVITQGGLQPSDIITLSLQGLLVALPKFERSLNDDMEAAAFLAKLTLAFTYAISPASHDSSQQTANVAVERLLSTFRISLKIITDSSSDLALRDVAYRISCAVLASLPNARQNGRTTPTSGTRQLLQLVQSTGDRLLAVVTEDVFSGRGVTRVSSLLYLDGLIALFSSSKPSTLILRALMKLNFVPVLIDSSLGNIASSFRAEEEMTASLAYFHTALALLLRLCQTTDGALLVFNSGLFAAIEDSKLFTTDPDLGLDVDNPTALKEFYTILTDTLRLITATVMQKGPQPGKSFLQQNRSTVQALFKQASRGIAMDVADELSRLILATGWLEDDEAALGRGLTNGFS